MNRSTSYYQPRERDEDVALDTPVKPPAAASVTDSDDCYHVEAGRLEG